MTKEMTTVELERFVEWEMNQRIRLKGFVDSSVWFIKKSISWGVSGGELASIAGFGTLCEILYFIHKASIQLNIMVVAEETGQPQIDQSSIYTGGGCETSCYDDMAPEDYNKW